ncbi:coiled-coil domain-containing protein 42, partial [Oxyura jamaicensis]|uniref:coiled-coil domain-containing protein 42 n=1 Tax=Oxyura jamaicensis TaxID=8884 RepID=UPI0015A6D9AB
LPKHLPTAPGTVPGQPATSSQWPPAQPGKGKALGEQRQEPPGPCPTWGCLLHTAEPVGRQGCAWRTSGPSCTRRPWAPRELLVAGAMAARDSEDLPAYFSVQYKENLLTLLKKLRLTEEDSLCPFICLQEKKKQAQQMQKTLEEKEEAFRERMEAISCRWRDLQTKEAQLKAHMKESGRVLQENDKLRIQTLKKASREREMKMQKQSELLRAKKELEALKNKHQKLSDRVQKYSIFSKYLEDVVKASHFEEIQTVIWRYKTLVRMRKDLLQAERGRREASEQAKELLAQYTEEKEEEILQYNNELAQLKLRFDEVHSDVLTWESRWAHIQNIATQRTLELGTIRMAILNLFQCISKQMKRSLNVPVDDNHKQLDMVQQFIQDHADISMEVKRKDLQKHQQAAKATEL